MQLLIWHRNVNYCLHEAYKFQREKLGPNHVSALSTLDAIADLMQWNNETQSALANYKSIIQQLDRNENSLVATRLNSLVLYKMHRIYADQGDIQTACKYLNDALIKLKNCKEFDDESYELERIIEKDIIKIKERINGNLNVPNKDGMNKSDVYGRTNNGNNKVNLTKINTESRQDDPDDVSSCIRDQDSTRDCSNERRDEADVSESISVAKRIQKINTKTSASDFLSTETRSKFAKFQKMYTAIQSSKSSKTSDGIKDMKKKSECSAADTEDKFKKLESLLASSSSNSKGTKPPMNSSSTDSITDKNSQKANENNEDLNAVPSSTIISSKSKQDAAFINPASCKSNHLHNDVEHKSIIESNTENHETLKSQYIANSSDKLPVNETINELLRLQEESSNPKTFMSQDLPRKEDPRFARYFDMLNAGLPKRVIKHAMVKDGIDSTIIDGDPNSPAKVLTGHEPAVLDDVTNLPPISRSKKEASKTLEPSIQTNGVALKDDPRFEKFFKMIKVGMPRDIVKHAMKRDGYDSLILDGDPNLPAVVRCIPETQPKVQARKDVRRTRVHWDTLREEVKSGSVWALVQEDEDIGSMHIDDVEIKQLFEAEKSHSTSHGGHNIVISKNSGGPKIKTPSSVKVIDPKRANNGGIILALIKISFDELARIVDEMDNSNLTQHQLEGIIEYLPTQNEIKSFNEYFSDCKSDKEKKQLINKMCECEKFMVAMMNVQEAEKKIRALIFRMEFDSAIMELEQDATSIDNACTELSSSLRLRKLLGIVLNVGNRVNMDKARAFSITSLLKLSHAKSMDKKTTFLHYVVKVAKRNGQDILKFKEDLPTLCKAEKVAWEQSVNGVKGLELNLKNIKDLVLSKEKSLSPGHMFNLTKQEMKTLSKSFVGQFVLEAALRIKHLKHRVDKTNHSYTKLLHYFHEDSLKSNEFFNIFVQFSKNVDVATLEIQHEEKAKQKKISNKGSSITRLNSKFRDKYRNIPSNSNLNTSNNDLKDYEDDLEERMEIRMKKSASHNYNSVVKELKSWISRKKV